MNANHKPYQLQQSLIERMHLLEKLQTAIHHKLTLIIAPPGYGKTTLALQFVQTLNIPTAWHTLEKQDQDLPNLVGHFLEALSVIAPEVSTIQSAAHKTAGELAIQVTDSIRDNIKTDFLYVMDDIHHLLEAPNAKTWLQAFVAAMPPTCHLVLIGQALPPLSIMELIAHREVISIGQEELGFNREEIRQLAAKIGSHLSISQLEEVFSGMLGWPAGTLLALQPLPLAIEAALFEGEKAPEALFDALANRLFFAQSAALQAFLLSSSTLTRLTPALCQAALGLSNSVEQLTESLRRNLFIIERMGGMVYHSLFRDFLQHKLRTQNLSQYLQYHTDAAQWFESENQLEDAFDHYVAAECWEPAASIAERSAHVYLGQGKSETLLRWKNALSRTPVNAPRFFYMCAMIHRDRYEYEAAALDADTAEAGFRTQGNTAGLIQITLFRATVHNQSGHYQEAINLAESFSADSSVPPNLRGYALAITGTAALHLHQLDQALELLQTALPLWRDTGDQFAVAQLLLTLEVTYLRLGRFSEAAQCVQEVLSIQRASGEFPGIVLALNSLGYHHHLMGDYQQAVQTLQEGLQMVSRIAENRIESSLLWTLGDAYRDQGAFAEAAQSYHRALQLNDSREPYIQASILISFATLRRWEGKLDEAEKLALEAKTLTDRHNLMWEAVLTRLTLDAIAVHRHTFEDVQQDLETIVAEWRLHPSPQLVQVLGIYAHGALVSGDKATAYELLKAATTHTNYAANLQPLIAEITHVPLLKAFVQQQADRYAVLVTELRHLETLQIITAGSDGLNAPTYSLRVSLLGREYFERDGQPVPLSDWQAASARELFYYLLFNRPSSRDEIALALWPDSSSVQIRGKFHSTLHRVRDAMGTNAIVFDNDLYSVNPNLDLWCDAVEFQAVVRQAQLSSPLLAHTESLWYRAVNLYRGEFLPAFDVDWVIGYRESLHQMYVDSLLALGNCVRVRGDAREAVGILKRALKLESYREDIYRALFQCYALLGEHGLIRQHMEELTRLLDEELGTTPSPETARVVQNLLD